MRFRNIKSAKRDGKPILCVLNFGNGERELHVMQSQDDPEWPWKYAYDNVSESVGPGVVTHWALLGDLP